MRLDAILLNYLPPPLWHSHISTHYLNIWPLTLKTFSAIGYLCNYAEICCACARTFSPAFFTVTSYTCKVKTTIRHFISMHKSIKICYIFKKLTECTCNNIMKTVVFTLQVDDMKAKTSAYTFSKFMHKLCKWPIPTQMINICGEFH